MNVRFATFLIGSLAGAAAVMMIQRNSRVMAMAGMAGQTLKRKAGEMMKDEAFGRFFQSRTGRERDSEAKAFRDRDASGMDGLQQVAHLAAQDSEVKRNVNEILDEHAKKTN